MNAVVTSTAAARFSFRHSTPFGIIGTMLLLTSISLGLTLLLCGGYAGMILMCQIGVLPALCDLAPKAYADAWRAMDAYMDRRMPPYKGALLLLNTVTLILLLVQRQTPLAVATGCSLFFSLSGLVLTVRQQLPLNAQLKAAPPGLTEAELLNIREQTVRGFRTRFYLAVAAFVVLSAGAVFWPLF